MLNNWLSQNYIEVLGAVSGLVYLYFSIRQIKWLWPLGIVTSVLYIYVFFVSKFYADMGLQVYYFFISFYGWYSWLYGKKENGNTKLTVQRAGTKRLFIMITITFILTFILAAFLIKFTDSPLPYWDAFTTAASIPATWMLARKIIENWLFWIVIDTVSIGLYIYKGLYPTVFLFIVYSTMAIIGYIKWNEELQ